MSGHVDNKHMTWNYRVIRHLATQDGTAHYAIHEVYYNEHGTPYMVSLEPAKPFGETLDELKSDLGMIHAALRKPALDYTIFAKKEEP